MGLMANRVKARELLPHLPRVKPEHFAVYTEETVNLARGDTVRITISGIGTLVNTVTQGGR